MVKRLKGQGTAIIYVSHKLEEIFRLGDRVTVLRDGRSVGTDRVADLDESTLISRMVGRTLGARHRLEASRAGEEILAVEHLGHSGYFDDVSFRLRRGEILGFAGLMGAGRTEVMSALFGLTHADRGTIHVRGKRASIRSPRDAINLGIGFVSEDRKRIGLVLSASVAHNLTLGDLRRCCRAGFIDPGREEAAAESGIRRFGIKTASRDQAAGLLSGGNQQKVVMAKVLFAGPEILILDEPTRGIDIGAKQEIYRLIVSWAREGLAILLVSSELPEILALSDRVIVMRAGRMTAELPGAGLSQEMILTYAMPN
jgi:ABC-type sugar transport system ATPase subunit